MPVVSLAQNRAMHSAAAGKSTLGIPAKVGADFTANQQKGSLKGLPERVSKRKPASRKVSLLRKGGAISDKAYGRRFGGTDQQPIDAASR